MAALVANFGVVNKMAPRRGTRSMKSVNNINYSKISLDDALCPVCRCILIRPVSLPCSHDFCQPCFEGAVADASFSCPLCSARFGSWHRGAKKDNRVVNAKLWDALQVQFPQQVRDRLRDSSDGPEIDSQYNSSPAEIKIANNVHQKTHRQPSTQKKKTTMNNMKKREQFAECVRIEKLQLDEQVARQIATEMGFAMKTDVKVDRRKRAQKVENQTMELPLKLEKNAKQKNLMNFTVDLTDSNDSIENECKYFKPIDHRNIPPSKSATILKVPAITKQIAEVVSGSPNGIINFTHSYNISAFAQFSISSPIEPLKVKAPKSRKRKFSDAIPKPSGGRRELDLMQTEIIYKNCVKNSKPAPVVEVPKRRPSTRDPPASKMRLRERKHSGSPLYGFAASELEAHNKPSGHRLEQEKNDLEFAKRLQQEYNKERYSMRSITCRRNVRPIKELVPASKCK